MKIVFNYRDKSYEITSITYQEYAGRRKTTTIVYTELSCDYENTICLNEYFHLTIDECIEAVKNDIREDYKNDK